jgi:hypothetical protein
MILRTIFKRKEEQHMRETNYEFQVGDTVKVTQSNKKSYIATIGCIGVIKKRSKYMGVFQYAVKIKNQTNPYCCSGLFNYKGKELTKVKTGEDTMESKYILHGLKSIAQVKFIEGTNTERTYQYLCFDESIEVGDTVVVKSAHHGFGVAVVDSLITDHCDMEDLAANGDTINREIVSKFNLAVYKDRKEERVRKAENDAKRKKLMNAMDKRIAESRNMAYYEKAAESDDEIKALLEQLKAIE